MGSAYVRVQRGVGPFLAGPLLEASRASAPSWVRRAWIDCKCMDCLADEKVMSEGTPEPRTQVMILVEATWEDQSGTVQSTRARMENRSASGACIRLKNRIEVGTRLTIQWRWEEFAGTARYCRCEGREYLVGIQRDKVPLVASKDLATKEDSRNEDAPKSSTAIAAAPMRKLAEQQATKPAEVPGDAQKVESVPKVVMANLASENNSDGAKEEKWNKEKPAVTLTEESEGLPLKEREKKQPVEGREAGKERKHMRRRWFELVHKDEREDMFNGNENGSGNNNSEVGKRAAVPAPVSVTERKARDAKAEEAASEQVELLSMEDIYRTAGIIAPRKGYSINKVVEMLHSEHLRGLPKEMRRASVLMALDAAGIPVEEVLQDAKARQEAIDSYETEQRKQFEAQAAQKAEENVQIQAELERVKARYGERLRRNLDGMAREKATFGNWLTQKQQEWQSIAEAVELCSKAPVPEPVGNAMPEVSLVDAKGKPV